MKRIKCSNHNSYIFVDNEDHSICAKYRWYRVRDWHSKTYHRYQTNAKIDGKRKVFPVHRLIMGFPKGIVDHINRKTHDNRKCNLRISTTLVNSSNCKIHYTNKTGYRGVCIGKNGKYIAQINAKNKKIYLGTFTNKKDAAKAYDDGIKKYRDGIGVFNFKEDPEE